MQIFLENSLVLFVNHSELKLRSLNFQICWHGNPLRERSTIGQLTSGHNPSPVGQRHMLYSPRCHHRIPQANLDLTHASREVSPWSIVELDIRVSQFLSALKGRNFLATGFVKGNDQIFHGKGGNKRIRSLHPFAWQMHGMYTLTCFFNFRPDHRYYWIDESLYITGQVL